MRKSILPILASLFCGSLFAQISTNNSLTPQQLVQNVLLGAGVTASNITFSGSPNAIGFFQGPSILGLDSGIIMTSGTIFTNANGPLGPNNSPSAGIDNNFPGDPDLAAISGVTSHNAAILQFDFVPMSDTIKFRYVFASEEYPEFSNSTVNDAFGFFLSGPGITGPYSNNSVNIALLPNTAIPVSINTVNNGGANTGPCTNCAYYVAHGTGTTPGLNTTIQYDGLTVVLTAIYPVTCGQTYHIKLAIGDGGDGVYDSGVFLEAGSFSSEGIQISTTTVSGDSTIVEGCESALFAFTRPSKFNDTLVIHYQIGGTAVNGIDYVYIPDSVIFLPGDTTVFLDIIPFADGITEGLETFIITVIQNLGCSGMDTIEIILYIWDQPLPIQAHVPDIIVPCNAPTVTVNPNITGGLGPFSYYWSTGDTILNPTIGVSPNPATYYLVVSGRCNGRDSTAFTIEMGDYTFTVGLNPPSCGNADGSININPANGAGPFYYSVDTGATFISQPVISNLPAGIYLVIGTDHSGCADTIEVVLNNLNGPVIDSLKFMDTPCHSDSMGWAAVFASSPTNGNLSYLWNDYYNQTTDTAFFLPAGEYIIQVSEIPVGGTVPCHSFAQVAIGEPSPLTATATTGNPSCHNIDGWANIFASGGTGPYTFGLAGSPSFSTDSVFGSLQANYYEFIVKDANGCTFSVFENLVAGPGPVIDNVIVVDVSCGGAGNSPLDSNGSIQIFGSSPNPPHYFAINNQTPGPGNYFGNLPAGTYTVHFVDATGCLSSQTIEITAPDEITSLPIPQPTSCDGAADGSVDISVGGGTPGYTVSWGGISSLNPPYQVSGLTPGTYGYTVTDNKNCKNQFTVTIGTVNTLGLILSGNVANCGRTDGIITAQGTGGNFPYEYSVNGSGYQASNLLGNLPSGVHWVTIKDNKGCLASDSIILAEALGVKAAFEYLTNTAENEAPVLANFINLSSGANSYYWHFGDGSSDSVSYEPHHVYQYNGTYNIMLVACYTQACCDTAFAQVEVMDTLYIPNVFSPNGDNYNEVFRIKSSSLSSIQAEIYNRWGQRVYSWDDPKGYWDGNNYGGKPCPDGTYFFKFTNIERSDGKKYPNTTGTVTLLR